jgi:pimeloyl-ACP methyl ester carboxylesterase
MTAALPPIPLVFLPGTLCDARLFGPVMLRLRDVAACSVGDVARSARVEAAARDVLAAAPPRFALAGLSYGGIVVFECVRQAPERVTHLALLNTTPHPPSDAMRARLHEFLLMAEQGEFRRITTDHLKDTMLHPEHRAILTLRQTILEMAEYIGIGGFLNQVSAQLARPDSVPTLAQIACPTLVMAGADDTVCPPAISQFMAEQIAGARLVVLERCGHLCTLEQPDAAADALRAWLTAGARPTEQETEPS